MNPCEAHIRYYMCFECKIVSRRCYWFKLCCNWRINIWCPDRSRFPWRLICVALRNWQWITSLLAPNKLMDYGWSDYYSRESTYCGRTKWPTCFTWYFHMQVLTWNRLYFDANLTKFHSINQHLGPSALALTKGKPIIFSSLMYSLLYLE